jgi:hypothetical protein
MHSHDENNKESGNYLRHHSQAYLIIFILCLAAFLTLFLTSITSLPIYQNLGKFEAVRGEFLIVFFALFILSYKNYAKYEAGLDGEKLVTDYLSKNLSNDYLLLNDLTRLDGRGNIDHILLSNNGIIAMETKNNKGEITFYGDNWNVSGWSPIYQVKGNAANVHDLIESSGVLSRSAPWVTGMVVFPKAKLKFNGYTSAPVKTMDEVLTFLKSIEGKNVYSTDEINKIVDLIIDSSSKSDANESGLLSILWRDLRDFFF